MAIEEKEKYKLFKDAGWTYDPIKGVVYTTMNKPNKYLGCKLSKPNCNVTRHKLAWYLHTGEIPFRIEFKDGDQNNLVFNNLKLITKDMSVRHKKEVIKQQKQAGTYVRKSGGGRQKSIKYLSNDNLEYELILSNGKGKLTEKGQDMLIKLSENLIRKFNYYRNDDLRYDCKMEGMVALLENWNKYDLEKYNNPFAYFTEIGKRAIVKGYHNRKPIKEIKHYVNYGYNH